MMRFFKNYFGPTLMKPWAKAIIIISYIVYIGFAIYGCLHMRTGVSFEKLSNADSYLQKYYLNKDLYFDQYGPTVNVIFTDTLNYSDPAVQNRISEILETFTNDTDFFYAPATQSWLKNFNAFLNHLPEKPQTEEMFINVLRYQFLKIPGFDT